MALFPPPFRTPVLTPNRSIWPGIPATGKPTLQDLRFLILSQRHAWWRYAPVTLGLGQGGVVPGVAAASYAESSHQGAPMPFTFRFLQTEKCLTSLFLCLSFVAFLSSSTGAAMAQGIPQEDGKKVVAEWGANPTPGVELHLVEGARREEIVLGADEALRVKIDSAVVIYELSASGLPEGKTYTLWSWQEAPWHDSATAHVTGYVADKSGNLLCSSSAATAPKTKAVRCPLSTASAPSPTISFSMTKFVSGEVLEVAVISTDQTVRAFVSAFPFPVEGRDGPCRLAVRLAEPNGKSFDILGDGFASGEQLQMVSEVEGSRTEGQGQASASGGFVIRLNPSVRGKNAGKASYAVIGSSCHPTVQYEWGRAARKDPLWTPAYSVDLPTPSGEIESTSFALDLQQPGKWAAAYRTRNPNTAQLQFVPRGETSNKWTELLTIKSFLKTLFPTVERALEIVRRDTLAGCPTAAWNVVEQTTDAAIFELSSVGCKGSSDEYQLGRFVQGAENIYVLSYTRKGMSLAGEERNRWIDVLEQSRVETKQKQ
jgi:hypothetical protein